MQRNSEPGSIEAGLDNLFMAFVVILFKSACTLYYYFFYPRVVSIYLRRPHSSSVARRIVRPFAFLTVCWVSSVFVIKRVSVPIDRMLGGDVWIDRLSRLTIIRPPNLDKISTSTALLMTAFPLVLVGCAGATCALISLALRRSGSLIRYSEMLCYFWEL